MNHLPQRFAFFALGVVINSFGVALITKGALGTSAISSVPNVVVVPGEGVVRAIAQVTKIRVGTVKAAFDITLIVIAGVMSLICFHELRGVGVGTVISALLVGPIINVINRVFTFQHRIQALALSRDGR
ncbi:DUF6198 family protein [Bifidobacterium pullorum]|uniref:DUF6198 family protein n=1 Tax=Bifidobacterium pullorum TaxID=78448 RepID=UPI003F1F57B5